MTIMYCHYKVWVRVSGAPLYVTAAHQYSVRSSDRSDWFVRCFLNYCGITAFLAEYQRGAVRLSDNEYLGVEQKLQAPHRINSISFRLQTPRPSQRYKVTGFYTSHMPGLFIYSRLLHKPREFPATLQFVFCHVSCGPPQGLCYCQYNIIPHCPCQSIRLSFSLYHPHLHLSFHFSPCVSLSLSSYLMEWIIHV